MPESLPLETGTLWPYLISRGLFPEGSIGAVREVGDGNMNRVFVATPLEPGSSGVAVKQAPPWIRRLGPGAPMSAERALIEARALREFARHAPAQTPRVLDVDAEQHAFTMEDLSDLRVLRSALDGGARFGNASREVGRFVGLVSAATSVAVLDSQARADLITRSLNPLLADITLTYLIGDPFRESEHNHHHPLLDSAVARLRADPSVATEVSVLRAAFGESAQSLIHGDLHSGSVMVGRRDGSPTDETVVKVIDPEFSMVGPIGLDLGLYVANVLLAVLRARALGDEERAADHAAQVGLCWDAFTAAWHERWPARADRELSDGALARHLAGVWRDTLGFAAIELTRRVAGYSHSSDLETLPDPGPASLAALGIAEQLLLDRAAFSNAAGEPDPERVAATTRSVVPA